MKILRFHRTVLFYHVSLILPSTDLILYTYYKSKFLEVYLY